jgi:hypothetical protein
MRSEPTARRAPYPGQYAALRDVHPWRKKTNPDRRVRPGPRRA